MRKVTKTVVDAFFARRSRKCGNTRTDGQTFYLHGNAIAKWRGDDLLITLAGWDTVTTRERLNGIGRSFGFSVFRDRGVTKINTRGDYGSGAFTWNGAVEMPHGEWVNPQDYVGHFADK